MKSATAFLVFCFIAPAFSASFTYQNGVITLYSGDVSFEGINDAGQIAGYQGTTVGTLTSFVYANGVYTPITQPGEALKALAINNAGQVFLNRELGSNAGFIYDNGTRTQIPDHPGAIGTTVYQGINTSGTALGSYGGFMYFTYSAGTFTDLALGNWSAIGIADSGQVFGYYLDNGGHAHGFIDTNGSSATFDVPGALNTTLRAISSNGYLAGTSTLGNYVDINGSFSFFHLSGYSFFPTGVNSSGEVVGVAFSGPVDSPEPAPLTLVGSALTAMAAMRARRSQRFRADG